MSDLRKLLCIMFISGYLLLGLYTFASSRTFAGNAYKICHPKDRYNYPATKGEEISLIMFKPIISIGCYLNSSVDK